MSDNNNNNNNNELKFIELLLQYAQEERLIDINRCLLAQDLYFDVLSLYNYILFNYTEKNNISRNIITLSAFKKFIQIDLEIKINDEILSKFFDFYIPHNINNINNSEKYLEYVQFIEIFYPRYNYQLRRFLQERNGLNKNIKYLNVNTIILLRKLFIRELHMIKYLIFHLTNYTININSRDIFKKISNNKTIITKQDLINFFNLYSNEINYTEEDINSLIVSLSINRNYNNNKKIIEGIIEDNFINIFNFNLKNNSFDFTFKDIIFNENKDKNSLWISIINNIIQLEKRIEESKILIITRNDFDIKLIMPIFLKENDEKIEIDYFLNKLNISLNNLEKELLLKRIDLTKKGYINKNELYDFFIPFNKQYRDKIELNNLNNNKEFTNGLYCNLNLILSKGTMIYINNLINVIIKGEKEINSKKIELNADNKFIENIFDEIINIPKENNNNALNNDIYEDYFIKEQLYKYITDKLNIKTSDDDLDLFYIRLDKLKRGKIKMLEFSDEMRYIL